MTALCILLLALLTRVAFAAQPMMLVLNVEGAIGSASACR